MRTIQSMLNPSNPRGKFQTQEGDLKLYDKDGKELTKEQLEARRKAPPAPPRISWGSIQRIDARKTHERHGQIKWAILGLGAGFGP